VATKPADRRLTFAVAAGAAVASAAASIPDARHFYFWADEFASAKVIVQPTLSLMLGQIVRRESTPPAWYLLAWLIHHAGVTVTGLRFLSVICGAALAGLSVIYARRFVSLLGAALVGIIVAFGGEFLRHNWELRAYAMFALLCLVFAMTLEWAASSPSKRRLAALAVVVALGSTTHYFFLFTLFAGLAWLWLTREFRSVRRRVTVASALGLIPLIVWSPWFAHQTKADHTRKLGAFALSKIWHAYARLLATGLPKHTWLVVVSVAIDILVVLGVILLLRRGGRARLCALLGIAPLVCAAILSYANFHILDYRNLIGGAPFLAIALVAVLDSIPRRAFARAALVAVFVLAVYAFAVARRGPARRTPAKSPIPTALSPSWRLQDPLREDGSAPAKGTHQREWQPR
jgi:hypothetical protein